MGFEVLSGGVKGCCNYEEKCIIINEGMDELQNIKIVIYEIVYVMLYDIVFVMLECFDCCICEVQVESVVYVVC